MMGSWKHFGVFSFQLATVINNYNSNLKTGRISLFFQSRNKDSYAVEFNSVGGGVNSIAHTVHSRPGFQDLSV